MDGSIDLSFESINDIDNIPSTQGMGWLASDLKQENWTVSLNSSAIEEIASMVHQLREKYPHLYERVWSKIISKRIIMIEMKLSSGRRQVHLHL